MKKHCVLHGLWVVILLSLTARAQDKLFTAGDYLNRDLYPKSMINLTWRGDTESFTWTGNDALLQSNATTPEVRDTMLKITTLNGKLQGMKQEELPRFPSITWLDNHRFYFVNEQKIYTYSFSDSLLKQENEYPEEADNLNICEKNLWVAYTIGNKLYVKGMNFELTVADEKNPGIVYGQVPSRNEFGIDAGSYWSPGGKLLAFYRIDQTEVTDYPLVDIGHRIAEASPMKYPMAGMKSQKVNVGVFNPAMNQVVYLQTEGPENQYLTSLTWDPLDRYIYLGLLNRDQNHLVMNRYDAVTGRLINTLFEEQNEKYVEPMHSLEFLENNPDEFIWQSRRDGWNHLYHYTSDGKLIGQVTKGEWEVTEFIGFDEESKHVFYLSTQASPVERHFYKASLKNGKTEQLTTGNGIHSILASKKMTNYINIFSNPQMAKAYYLIGQEGKRVGVLREDANPWKDYKTGDMQIFTIKADDGVTDLYCRLIKPVDFDAGKKYPVVVYVYGGPHSQLITNAWTGGAGFWLNYLAQQGYVVFTLDNRGSSNRGFNFESVIHRQVGETEMADQMQGVRYLNSLPFVDTARIGLDGWSYGGFMTISLMLRNPGVFKAACAGGPVINWEWYEVMYGERYMDTPMQNPEGYEKSNLLNYAGNLRGKLLIIHGTNDNTVVWQNSLSFLDECIKKGRQVDYFVYPGADHNMRGKARVHLFEKISDYFDRNLK